jgi:hypothetical protein
MRSGEVMLKLRMDGMGSFEEVVKLAGDGEKVIRYRVDQ